MLTALLALPCWRLPFGKPLVNGVCMLILDYKLRVNQAQQAAIDEAIRTVQFIRNKCLRKVRRVNGDLDSGHTGRGG